MSDGFFLADLPDSVSVGDLVEVSGAEGRHAATVRRIGPGEVVTLTDGRGVGVRGPVADAGRDWLRVRVEHVVHAPEPSPMFIAVQALPKNDRAELAVDLLTELGIDEIVPWQASRSVVRWTSDRAEKSRAKWQTVARQASKQARRLRIPAVRAVASTAEVVRLLASADSSYVMHESATAPVTEARPTGVVVFVIGPEGGVSPDELAAFEAAGARPLLMGDTVLRTSTAGAVAVTQLRLLAGLAGVAGLSAG